MKPLQVTPLKEQPGHVEAMKQINTLNGALAKVDVRILEIEALLAAHTPDAGSSHVEAALQFAATGVVRGPGNTPHALSEENVILRQQREALQKAIAAQYASLQLVTSELSAEVSRAAQAAHKSLAARMLKLLQDLDALQEEERVFIRDLEDAGYSPRFQQYVAWPMVGRLRDKSESLLWYRERELRMYVD